MEWLRLLIPSQGFLASRRPGLNLHFICTRRSSSPASLRINHLPDGILQLASRRSQHPCCFCLGHRKLIHLQPGSASRRKSETEAPLTSRLTSSSFTGSSRPSTPATTASFSACSVRIRRSSMARTCSSSLCFKYDPPSRNCFP